MSLSPIFRSALTDSPALHRKARIFRALALSAGLVAAAVMAPGTADATVYQYQLNDHPNGTAGTSNYGLRLDGLFGRDYHAGVLDGRHSAGRIYRLKPLRLARHPHELFWLFQPCHARLLGRHAALGHGAELRLDKRERPL